MWSVYGHGSAFTGLADPHDVDVMVITDEPLSREDAARRVGPLLSAYCPQWSHLPIDVTVRRLDEMTSIERVISANGVLLDGDDIAATFAPVRACEWAWMMTQLMLSDDGGPCSVFAALRAIWAADGRVVIPKSAVPSAAVGTKFEDLAAAAWQHRHATEFDHPDLAAAISDGFWAAAGDAATDTYADLGYTSRQNLTTVFTVYRNVLTADEIATATPADTPKMQEGGRTKAFYVNDAVAGCLTTLAVAANWYWWGYRLALTEQLEIHHYQPPAEFAPHVDRHPLTPDRVLNVVAMIQPADRGGRLSLHLGNVPTHVDLDPGDVVVFDAATLHSVTPVEAGERVTVLTHAQRPPRTPGQAWT